MFKKDRNRIRIMIEKGIRGGITHAMHRYGKANNKYMKNYDKNKKSSYLMYLDTNNLYGWAISQKYPVDGFKWKENTSKFNEDFIRNYGEDIDRQYIIEVDVKYPKQILSNKHKDLPFLPEKVKTKLNGSEKLVCNIYNKKTTLST